MISSVRTLSMIIMLLVFTTGCTSKNNGPVPAQSFEWRIDNGDAQTAETIIFIRVNGYNSIYATKGNTEVLVATNSTATGIYSLAAGNGNMGLKIAGNQWANLGCDINITSNSNSLLKGSFNGTFGLVNVDTVNISGTFEDVVYY